MKMKRSLVVIIAVSLTIAGLAQATLIDNGDGTVTDTDFAIMWLKNANLAGTAIPWDEAMAWANNLVFAGFDDWRLPTALNQDGSGLCGGFNCTDSEMGHLYYEELANPAGGPPTNTDPFINVQTKKVPPGFGRYWLGTELGSPPSGGAWMFVFYDGAQGGNNKNQLAYAWAVRTIPEPTTYYVDGDAVGGNDGSSWEDAFDYLQDALAVAWSGEQIWVAEGIYKPDEDTANPSGTGDREATFQLINGVGIYGGYAGHGEPDPNTRNVELYETILSGDLAGNDIDVNNPRDLLNEPTRAENSYHVFYHPEGMNLDNTAILEGFTVSGGNANGSYPHSEGGGMFNKYNSPTVTNCIFEDNSVVACGGGMYNLYSSPQITNCTFFSNSGGTGGGMRNCRSEPLIANCIFSNNQAMGSPWGRPIGGGISNYTYPAGSHNPTIINCTFTGNIAGYGGGMHNDGSRPSVANCIVWSNSPQQITGAATITHCDVQGGWPGEGNINADPCFVDADSNDYHLLPDSPCINTGDPSGDYTGQTDIDGDQRVINGRVDMGADEFRGPIYVDNDAPEDPEPNNPDISDSNENGSLAHPFDAIQEAIDVASNGETVVVLDGTYTGEGNRDIDFLGKAITVRSIDPNDPNIVANTIIDCNGTEAEPHRGFKFHSGEDANSIIAGFTITNGYGPDELFDSHWYSRGGAIFCRASSPTITNCIITSNSVTGSGGGGIFCYNSSPIISNCAIKHNTTYGFAVGGGIYCRENSSPVITNCNITGNSSGSSGSGIFLTGSNPIITNCTISGNTAKHGHGGGISSYFGSGTVINCTISGNKAGKGGGIYLRESILTITNCTIIGNTIYTGEYAVGSGIFSFRDSSAINNSIVWDNLPQQVTIAYEFSIPIVNYSDVQRGWEGEGNINADPCFVDPGYWDVNGTPYYPWDDFWVDGDYHLLAGSPCIDAGDNSSVPADIHDLDGDGNTTEPIPFDLDGNPRIVDGNDDGNLVVDMGAFEAMVSCFGVNHVKLETKAGKKGNKVELKGTFSPALPIDFAVDDVAYIIDDGQGNALAFLIPAGSFEPEGKPGKQKFKFHSPKGSQPDINARFDFDKCKFELKAKKVPNTDEITGTTLAIELWAGANLVQEVVEVKIKPRHTEYKRQPKLSCCPKCKGIALLEVTSDQGVFVFEPDPGKEKLKRKTVVDDGMNGRVKIDTSCSKPLEVGDVFGVYTVTDLIKIFDD